MLFGVPAGRDLSTTEARIIIQKDKRSSLEKAHGLNTNGDAAE